MQPLVWFRADLRVRDNIALHNACRRATRGVVGVFTVCPEQWKAEHDWGDARVEFLLRNLSELSRSLEKLNIPLLFVNVPRFDAVPDALCRLAARHGCDGLFFNREYEWNEARRDEAVTERFMQAGREVHAYTDQVILPPGAVRTGEGGFYTVYSPFRKRWERVFSEGDGAGPLPASRRQPEVDVRPDPVPDRVEGFDPQSGRPDLWKAGEAHAKSRLDAFIDARLGSYKDKRDFPGVNGTSTLSPYLAAGVLSPRQCLHAALKANGGRLDSGNKGAVSWIQELVWREFYKHILVGFPRVSRGQPFRLETRDIPWRDDDQGFEAWCEGRTGVPIVDAAMRQLNQTGWMHNRLRMIAAMFLTKNLLIDWRRGEKYFMQHLVDGDLASNNGGWQWSASTGTDAAPYFRIFNPVSQSRKFDPDGSFIRRFVPELESADDDAIHDPADADLLRASDYPEPIVDLKTSRARAIETFQKVLGAGAG